MGGGAARRPDQTVTSLREYVVGVGAPAPLPQPRLILNTYLFKLGSLIYQVMQNFPIITSRRVRMFLLSELLELTFGYGWLVGALRFRSQPSRSKC